MEEFTAFDIQHFMNFIDNITFSEMFNMFFIPITILIAFILLGIWINRLITNKVNKHFDTDELTLQYVMIRCIDSMKVTKLLYGVIKRAVFPCVFIQPFDSTMISTTFETLPCMILLVKGNTVSIASASVTAFRTDKALSAFIPAKCFLQVCAYIR